MNRVAIVLAVALVIVGAAYCLQHGIYVGSNFSYRPTYQDWVDKKAGSAVRVNCRYLLAGGVHEIHGEGQATQEEAQMSLRCPLFLQ